MCVYKTNGRAVNTVFTNKTYEKFRRVKIVSIAPTGREMKALAPGRKHNTYNITLLLSAVLSVSLPATHA